MSIFLKFKKKRKENLSGKATKPQSNSQITAVPEEYELDDISYIRALGHTTAGPWQQYDVLLDARGYGWEDMKSWAEYMSKNDLDISIGTLTVAEIIGAQEKEMIEQYHSVGNIQQIPSLETEWGVLSMGGVSKKLHAPVKIVWMNQTQYLRLFTLVSDEILVRRYIETVIRRTFGTPDEMKLARPIPSGQ